jgi:hypothetical protein
MRTFFRRSARTILVLFGIVVLTSISIDATDSFSRSQSALGIFASYVTTKECPAEMLAVSGADDSFCIDQFEAGVAPTCLVSMPQSVIDTARNANDPACLVVSQSDVLPWRFVTVMQASELCARVGKRLPTVMEWYQAARGTPDTADTCNLTGTLQVAGLEPQCRSGVGAFDMIGNVWELVSGEVRDGHYDGRVVPAAGYVAEVTEAGIASETSESVPLTYNADYFWSAASGTYAMMRGGFYGSGEDGGIYSTHTSIAQDFASNAIGFRCAKSL